VEDKSSSSSSCEQGLFEARLIVWECAQHQGDLLKAKTGYSAGYEIIDAYTGNIVLVGSVPSGNGDWIAQGSLPNGLYYVEFELFGQYFMQTVEWTCGETRSADAYWILQECDQCVWEFESEYSCDLESWQPVKYAEILCEAQPANLDFWQKDPKNSCKAKYRKLVPSSIVGQTEVCLPNEPCIKQPQIEDYPKLPKDGTPIDPPDSCCDDCVLEFSCTFDCDNDDWGAVNYVGAKCVVNAAKNTQLNEWIQTEDSCVKKHYVKTAEPCKANGDCNRILPPVHVPGPPEKPNIPFVDCCKKSCIWEFLVEWNCGAGEWSEVIFSKNLCEKDPQNLNAWVQDLNNPCKHSYRKITPNIAGNGDCDTAGGCQQIPINPADYPEKPIQQQPNNCCNACVWEFSATYFCEGFDGTSSSSSSTLYSVVGNWVVRYEGATCELDPQNLNTWIVNQDDSCTFSYRKLSTDGCEFPNPQGCSEPNFPELPDPPALPPQNCCKKCYATYEASYNCNSKSWDISLSETTCEDENSVSNANQWIYESSDCSQTYKQEGNYALDCNSCSQPSLSPPSDLPPTPTFPCCECTSDLDCYPDCCICSGTVLDPCYCGPCPSSSSSSSDSQPLSSSSSSSQSSSSSSDSYPYVSILNKYRIIKW
jgi:hypothetical protein